MSFKLKADDNESYQSDNLQADGSNKCDNLQANENQNDQYDHLQADDNGKESDECDLPAVEAHLGHWVAPVVVTVAPVI